MKSLHNFLVTNHVNNTLSKVLDINDIEDGSIFKAEYTAQGVHEYFIAKAKDKIIEGDSLVSVRCYWAIAYSGHISEDCECSLNNVTLVGLTNEEQQVVREIEKHTLAKQQEHKNVDANGGIKIGYLKGNGQIDWYK